MFFFESNSLSEIKKLSTEIENLEIYINNLLSKEKIIIKKIENEAYFKSNRCL